MSRDLTKDLFDLKNMVDLSIGNMITTYNVANVSTFFVYVDINDYDPDCGDADDQTEFLDAVREYIDAITRWESKSVANVRLVAALTNGQEVVLHQVGDFDLEPDLNNEKAHRDWRFRQGEPDVT